MTGNELIFNNSSGGTPERMQQLRFQWIIVGGLFMAMVFAEAVFAGAMLSGFGWARFAHLITSLLLIGGTVLAGIASVLTLRRTPNGGRISLIMLTLAVLVTLQVLVGKISADGANLLWLHVPLGVALVGVAGATISSAKRLGI